MTIDGDLLTFIRKEISRQVNIILSGQSADNDQFSETINNLLPGISGITGRPVMHPFGYASRASEGTIQVTAQQGDHPGNRIILGHRDANRPTMEQGEGVLYSSGGYQVRIQNGSIQLGKDGTFENVVMGDTLNSFLISLLNLIVQHQHIGNLGYQTSQPTNAAQFTTLADNNLANDFILAKDGGRF